MSERTTYRMEIDAEHMRNIFGEEDHYIQKIEKELNVVIVNRDGYLNIIGSEQDAKRAVSLLSELYWKTKGMVIYLMNFIKLLI